MDPPPAAGAGRPDPEDEPAPAPEPPAWAAPAWEAPALQDRAEATLDAIGAPTPAVEDLEPEDDEPAASSALEAVAEPAKPGAQPIPVARKSKKRRSRR